MSGHQLYRTGDTDAPEAIKDRNGEVALDCCRKCGRGESDLTEPCDPPVPDDHYQDDFDDGDCWQCGGEGRVNHCIDGCCVDQDDIYCDLCSTRCDICRPLPSNEGAGTLSRDNLTTTTNQEK